MPSSSSHHYTTPNQTDTHYTSSGNPQGTLIIFLHGLGGSTETFSPLIPYLDQQQRFHLVAVDIEGFGQTPLNRSRQPLSFPRYVSDLHHLVAHLQERALSFSSSSSPSSPTNKIVLVGHSLGAIIALHYTVRYPSAVAGLMLLGVGRSVRGIPPAQQRMRALATTAREKGMDVVAETAVATNFPADFARDDVKEQVRRAVAACGAEAYAQTAENVASDGHVDPDYGVVTCPTMFVAGDVDVISPVQRSQDLSKLVGGPAEVTVVKSGHQMILQDLDGVKKAVDRFLVMLGNSG